MTGDRSSYVLADMSDVSLGGFVMTSADNADFVARTVRDRGWWAFERPLPAILLRCCQRWPGLVLDVGSSSGFYSLLAAAAHDANRIMAFEAFAPALEVLGRNIAINVLGDRISIIPKAVSAAPGEARLFVPPPLHGLLESRSSLERAFNPEHEHSLAVETLALDDLSGNLEGLTLIKIDVEGHEAEVLKGAGHIISTHRPILALGVLGGAHAALEHMRARLGYQAVLVSEAALAVQRPLAPDPRGWNYLLVPDEKWDAVTAIIVELGLELERSDGEVTPP